MYSTYVLYSPEHDKIYIGQSSQIETRLHFHNHGPKKGWTANSRLLELIHEEEFDTRSEAIQREKELKKARGRRWIWEELLGRKK